MVLLKLSQGDTESHIACFETLEEGRAFVAQLPGYRLVEEEAEGFTYSYETLSPADWPDYVEIDYRGNRVPLSRHMFPSSEVVDVDWLQLPNLSRADQGLVEGSTRVDAYIIDNDELRGYVEARERGFARVRDLLEARGYRVARDFAGSEDGEAILYGEPGAPAGDNRILVYLDPGFVLDSDCDDDALSAWLDEQLGES